MIAMMVTYLNKLFSKDNRWPISRRKSIDISQPKRRHQLNINTNNNNKKRTKKQKSALNELNMTNEKENLKPSIKVSAEQENKLNPMNSYANNNRLEQTLSMSTCESTSTSDDDPNNSRIETLNSTSGSTTTVTRISIASSRSGKIRQNHKPALSLTPSLSICLYLVFLTAIAIKLASCQGSRLDHTGDPRILNLLFQNGRTSGAASTAAGGASFPSTPIGDLVNSIDWPRIGSRLWSQLELVGNQLRSAAQSQDQLRRDRWPAAMPTQRPTDHSQLLRSPIGGQTNLLTRTLNRIRSRIGARNTIRVHNAFRDLSWQILSRLSMPTPVIYELRRQNFYSLDEDLENDSMHNKNTSRTVRTRRLLDDLWSPFFGDNEPKGATSTEVSQRRQGEEVRENLRKRLQRRLNSLVAASRNLKLPAIFSFKRSQSVVQQPQPSDQSKPESNQGLNDGSRATTKPTSSGTSTMQRRRSRLRLSASSSSSSEKRRKRDETDRQMIQIDGKQYYVDDDGELKELKENSKSE